MKTELFRHGAGDRLLIFFNGWGMDSSRAAVWDLPGTDLLVLSEYTESDRLPEVPARYSRCAVLAWSFGVWRAAALLSVQDKLPPGPRVAVNGTLEPLSAETGIDPVIFEKTLRNWLLPETREKFLLRMTGARFPISRRAPEFQQEELAALERAVREEGPVKNPFRQVFCGRRDRIFPFEAQKRFWEKMPDITVREGDFRHDPFGGADTLREILDSCL